MNTRGLAKIFNRKKKDYPVQSVCRDCGTDLQGAYCHNCGQYMFAGLNHSVKSLVYNVFDSMFSIDNKILKTLKLLFFYPGKLTNEYLKGHISRYVHPSKLFWFISIVFFALLTSQISFNKVKKEGKEIANEIKRSQDNLKMSDSIRNQVYEQVKLDLAQDSVYLADELLNQIIAENTVDDTPKREKTITDNLLSASIDNYEGNEAEYVKLIKAYVSAYLPYVILVLIPFFAFLLFLFYRKKVRYYADHVVFALHFHAFVFLFYSICILLHIIFPKLTLGVAFYIWIPLIYLMLSIYFFYRPRIAPAILKLMLLLFLHSIIVIVIFACSLALYLISEFDESWVKLFGLD